MENIYLDNAVTIKQVKLSTEIHVQKEVNRVTPGAPYCLFNLIMDEVLVIEEVKTRKGCTMHTQGNKMLCYTDDVVLFDKHKDDLQCF